MPCSGGGRSQIQQRAHLVKTTLGHKEAAMAHMMTRGISATPPRSVGYWSVMVGGIVALLLFYACILLFGQAW
ncbi:hypothetical protein AA0522_1461 [Gluconacetobacter liquefaciens NRIC 0522]|nr:hypothetical protein AA0522_1461 [Gluconacetobacter liquefaciens NRIC 0522]